MYMLLSSNVFADASDAVEFDKYVGTAVLFLCTMLMFW